MTKIELQPDFLETLSAIEAEYRHPVLLYDLKAIRGRLERLDDIAKRTGVHFMLAHKAFPFEIVTKLASSLLSGFDISNEKELQQVASHAKGRILSITGPTGHTKKLDVEAIAPQTTIWNISSPEQISAVESYVGVLSVRLAINHSNVSIASDQKHSRFGFCSLSKLSDYGIDPYRVEGIHMHAGWEDNTAESYIAMAKIALEQILTFTPNVEWVNLGGSQHNLTFRQLESSLLTIRSLLPNNITIAMEPGNFCFKGTGFLVARIIDQYPDPTNEHCHIVILDASKDCHMKWSNPVFLLPQSRSGKLINIRVCGASCYENDYIGSFMVPGDDVLVPGAFVLLGAINGYSAAWNHSFNGIDAAEVIFHE